MFKEVKNHLQQLLSAEIIRPSYSSWSSKVVLVRKKDKSQGMCVYFRQIISAPFKIHIHYLEWRKYWIVWQDQHTSLYWISSQDTTKLRQRNNLNRNGCKIVEVFIEEVINKHQSTNGEQLQQHSPWDWCVRIFLSLNHQSDDISMF